MQEYLAIASVPIQSWGALFEAGEALCVGTIFQDLNKPFFAADAPGPQGQPETAGAQRQSEIAGLQERSEIPEPQSDRCRCGQKAPAQEDRQETRAETGFPGSRGGHSAPPEQRERERMLLKIQETGFVLDDLRLYMDTHPDDGQGLALLKEKLAERRSLFRTFAERFYPLTPDCTADIYERQPALECYCWQKGPMPWEGACV